MPTVTRVRGTSTPTTAALPLASFQPTRLVTLRDGGSMICDGMLNKSFTAKVRMDGAINSSTRGEFFVSRKHFLKPAEAEKPMSLDELKGFLSAVKRHMAQTPGRQADYERLADRLREAIDRKRAPAISKIPTSIQGPNASAQVEAYLWKNLMPTRDPGPRPVLAKVTVSGTGFNDAPPTFKAARIEVYEYGTNKKVFSANAPKVQESEVRRGTKEQSYRLEIPASALDMTRKYTVVVNCGINGAQPKLVRSDYLPINKVH